MKAKSEREVAQSCPTLSDPMNYSLPGSSIHGIFQARVLEWGAIAFSGSYPTRHPIKQNACRRTPTSAMVIFALSFHYIGSHLQSLNTSPDRDKHFFPHKVPYFMSLTDILSFHQLIPMEFTACYQIAAICSCLPACQSDCFCSFPMWRALGHGSKWARLTAPGSQGSAISGREAMRQAKKWEGKFWLVPVTARDPQEPPTWWSFLPKYSFSRHAHWRLPNSEQEPKVLHYPFLKYTRHVPKSVLGSLPIHWWLITSLPSDICSLPSFQLMVSVWPLY